MERMRPPGGGKSRERVLNNAEIKAIWQACEGRFGGIVKLCLLTGLRRTEAAAIETDWIVGDTLTLPGDNAKNHLAHTIPLTPLALEVIAEHRSNSSYLFPVAKLWREKGKHYNAWGKDKPKLDQAAQVFDWWLHDLRRTFATCHGAVGTPPHIIEKLLNHQTGKIKGVALVYNRFEYLEEMRQAQLAYEKMLRRIIDNSASH